jgi:hypothetical protein
VRKYFNQPFWAVLITLNTIFLLNNIVIDEYEYAAVNFFTALLCWHGYFRVKNDNTNKEEDEE